MNKMDYKFHEIKSFRDYLANKYTKDYVSKYQNVTLFVEDNGVRKELISSVSDGIQYNNTAFQFFIDVTWSIVVGGQQKFSKTMQIGYDVLEHTRIEYDKLIDEMKKSLQLNPDMAPFADSFMSSNLNTFDVKALLFDIASTYLLDIKEFARKEINRYVSIHSDEIADYLKIEEKIEEMLPIPYLREIIDHRHGQELKHALETELRSYHHPNEDVAESKKAYIYDQTLEFIAVEIVLNTYDVKSIVKSRKHKIVYDMLQQSGSPVKSLSINQASTIYTMIQDGAPVNEILSHISLIVDISYYIKEMFKDPTFTSRFDEFYYRYMDNKFYQNFMLMARENGFKR